MFKSLLKACAVASVASAQADDHRVGKFVEELRAQGALAADLDVQGLTEKLLDLAHAEPALFSFSQERD